MPDPKVLTSTTIVAGAQPSDVRVVETRRPNRPHDDVDQVHVQIARGACAIQLYGTLAELQLLTVAVTDGLVEIGQARGLEGR